MACCLKVIQGSSFAPQLRYKTADGVYIDITYIGIECWIGTLGGERVVDLQVIKLDQQALCGGYTIRPVDTTAWPEGELYLYIRYTVGDVVLPPSKETIVVESL